MQAELARDTERINYVTRSSIFMPLLLVTQINAGIYMVFGGPHVNRLYPMRASVLATRQIISIIILIIANLLSRKFNMKMVTKRDWKYFFLCGNPL